MDTTVHEPRAVGGASSRTLAELFEQLADEWELQTGFMSSTLDRSVHPLYQRIIGLGPQAVPLVLERMRDEGGGHWNWALEALTGRSVQSVLTGNIATIASEWVAWGRQEGLV